MKFIKKVEKFIYQLQYAICIEPEPIISKMFIEIPVSIEPNRLKELIKEHKLVFPFIPEVKVLELKHLMKKEKISFDEAQDICSNFALTYWGNSKRMPIIFPEMTEDFFYAYRCLNQEDSINEIKIAYEGFCEYFISTRKVIYEDMLYELADLPPRELNDLTYSSIKGKIGFLVRPDKKLSIEDFKHCDDLDQNLHPRIFKNRNAFKLFEYWHKQVPNASQIANYCFIYWKMISDEFMHNIKPKEYKDWLLASFNVDLGEHWKQLHRCSTDEKERLYSMAKQQFKSQ